VGTPPRFRIPNSALRISSDHTPHPLPPTPLSLSATNLTCSEQTFRSPLDQPPHNMYTCSDRPAQCGHSSFVIVSSFALRHSSFCCTLRLSLCLYRCPSPFRIPDSRPGHQTPPQVHTQVTVPLLPTPKPPVFPRNITSPAPPRYSDSPKRTSPYPRSPTQIPASSAGKTALSRVPAVLQRGQMRYIQPATQPLLINQNHAFSSGAREVTSIPC
jgi:hypothetical protein